MSRTMTRREPTIRRGAGLAAALAALVVAAPASAAAPDQRVVKLERQVKALTARVKTLETQNERLGRALSANFTADACLSAQTADLVQSTWSVIDQIAQAVQARTYFGPQNQISDGGNCGYLINPEVPRMGIRTPPVITYLVTLIDWFG